MKKGIKKLLAVTSAITLLGCSAGSLVACGDKDKGGDDIRSQTLVIASEGEFNEKFSPLFCSSAYDQDVVSFTTLGIISSDRNGDYVLDGMDAPAVREYNGKNYEYRTPGKLEAATADGVTTYTITIRQDLKYSDGTPITIDDYLFNFYCLVDTSYSGSATLGGLDIVGLADYRTNGQQDVADAKGKEIKDLFTKKIAPAYNGDGELAGNTDLSAYVTAGVLTADEKALAEKVIGWGTKTAKATSFMRDPATAFNFGSLEELAKDGFGLPAETAASIDSVLKLYEVIYGLDYSGAADDAAKWAIAEYAVIFNEFAGGVLVGDYSAYEPEIMNFVMAEVAENADKKVNYVSGVTRVNDYQMTIKVNGTDNAVNQGNFGSLNPMKISYYGNGEYNYAEGNFGFEKGKMNVTVDTAEKTRNPGPSCSGAYVFDKYENGVVYFHANPYYFEGEPATKYIEFRYINADEVPAAVNSGTIDIGTVNYSKDTTAEIAGYSNIDTVATPFLGYGYLGIQADRVKVGADSSSEESKNLRKAYMTVLAAYRSYTVESYYGETASVIEYPISTTSWAAPKPTDPGYEEAYSKKVDGTPIYTAGMTTEQKQAAALEAAAGYFEAAGFHKGEDGKFTDVPTFVASIGSQGTTHPSLAMLQATSKALKTIGVTLTVSEIQATALFNAMDACTLDIYVAAWGATLDPDLTQTYRSTSYRKNPGYTSGTNHYGIQDAALDELIDTAKVDTNRTTRKATIKEAFDVILDWGVELPVYQRSDAFVYSSSRIDSASMPQDLTAYYGWKSGLDRIKKK